MIYCRLCTMPSSRPDLHVDQAGVCDACRWAEAKKHVDWRKRKRAFEELAQWAKVEAAARKSTYDCIVGVSGGKDSTFIVAQCLKYGLHPLGINFEPSRMTPLGQRNLDNLGRLCDVIQVRRNAEVYRRLRRIGLKEVGDSEWPNHLGIFSSVLREAVLRRIPLVIFGENPQAEYAAGRDGAKEPKPLDRAWLEEFGGLLGMRLSDMESKGFEPRDLAPYRCPDVADLHHPGLEVRSIFLGDYFFWDTVKQAKDVLNHGFTWAREAPHGAWWRFENLDDTAAVVFHDYLGYLKYGYTRMQAQLSIEIRHGYTSREAALEELRASRALPAYPPPDVEYEFCSSVGMEKEEVQKACKRFVNLSIFDPGSVSGRVSLNPVLKDPPR